MHKNITITLQWTINHDLVFHMFYYEIYYSVLRQVCCYPSSYPVLFYFLLLRNIKLRYIVVVYISKKFQSPARVLNFLSICLSQFGSCYSKSTCRKGIQQERQEQ